MQQFQFSRAGTISDALQKAAGANTAQQGAQIRFVAGGTTLLDLMKLDVEQPKQIIDINRLPLSKVEEQPGGGLKIGALVRNSDLAHHPAVLRDYPVLSQAFSQELRPSCEIWQPQAATCCSALVVFTFVTPPCLVTSARPAAAVPQSTDITACWRLLAQARIALPLIRPT